MTFNNLEFRPAQATDRKAIWDIIRPIIRKGGTYAFSLDITEQEMMGYWMGADKRIFVAEMEGEIVGTFFIKANQPDMGNHVCNAGFMVAEEHAGKGIGRQMGIFALEQAKRLGYLAMQFNFVISTNLAAIKLWQDLGFNILGEVPEAYRHPEKGLVAVFVMHRGV